MVSTSKQATVTDKEFENVFFKEYIKLQSGTAPTGYILDDAGNRVQKIPSFVSIPKLRKVVIAKLKDKTFKRRQFVDYMIDLRSKLKDMDFWLIEKNPGSTGGGIIHNGKRYHFLHIVKQ